MHTGALAVEVAGISLMLALMRTLELRSMLILMRTLEFGVTFIPLILKSMTLGSKIKALMI